MTNEEFNKMVEDSKYILDLPDDWDDDGSPAYKEKTLQRACNYIKMHLNYLRDQADYDLGVPKIWPGPNGSIDVFWTYNDLNLLVNVPVDESKMIDFHIEHINGVGD